MRWFMRQNPETGEWDIPVWKARLIVLTNWEVWVHTPIDVPRENWASLPFFR
jgi:hypothetical protein